MYRIKQLGKMTGISPETIRYYERIGVLPQARRAENGYRVYSDGDAEYLRFVTRARSLNFSLEEIKEIIALRERGEAPCAYVINQIDSKVEEIDHRIAGLIRLKMELQELQAEARRVPPAEIEAKSCVCHLIENQGLSVKEMR